jgi:hypothetical protein
VLEQLSYQLQMGKMAMLRIFLHGNGQFSSLTDKGISFLKKE